MKTLTSVWRVGAGWDGEHKGSEACDLVLSFFDRELVDKVDVFEELNKKYPSALIVGCSTCTSIVDASINAESITATSIAFEKSKAKFAEASVNDAGEFGDSLEKAVDKLKSTDLKHVLVFSDGLAVNGTLLIDKLSSALPESVTISGGLAGDGARFKSTYVICNGKPKQHAIALVGLYGNDLKIGLGSVGGWDAFGPERQVTSSSGNVLKELDNEPALDLYKTYLGEKAKDLPASALLFPLNVKSKEDEVVRTILAVDDAKKTMTFAGDIPEGATVQLMKSNVSRLVDGAEQAAEISNIGNSSESLGLLVSCIGRKLVLKNRVEEEIEAVKDVLGSNVSLAGFYSYGEICPKNQDTKCQLHNQTMTITVISE